MSEIIITSIGLVLIIEGILYFLIANNLNKLLNIISAINPQTIKNISAFCALMGLCLIYFTFKFYDN